MNNEIQNIDITTDWIVRININNSTVKTNYGMPVKDFIEIMDKAFIKPTDLAPPESDIDIGLCTP